MQERLHEFERLEVCEQFHPPHDKAFVIPLKWILRLYLISLGGANRNDLWNPDKTSHTTTVYKLKKPLWVETSSTSFAVKNKNTKKGNALLSSDHQVSRATFVMEKDPSIREETEASHCPNRKEVWKRKTEDYRIEDHLKAMMTEAEQLKIITKRSRKETHSSHASGSGADEGTGVTPGVPDAPDYDSEDDISWKSSDDDQDDEKAQDDENEDKNDVNEYTQDDEDDDVHDDDENAQDDDDEEQTKSEDDGDDFIHPKLTTHDDEIIHEEETDEDDTFDPIVHTPSHISSSDDEDSDNDVEGTNVEGAKSDEDATYEEDQGNEAVEDINANLEGRDDVMIDVILPQVQATQEIEDTHVTLTPVNPDGQQQSSSVSSGFVSNMLNPNQDTGVDDIFEQHAEATSLIDTPATAIVEPSFSEPTNRPPTPNPLVIQIQQPPILTPATTTSSSLQNLPNFASLFGFDYRLKALEDNFSELRQTNQYAEALSSIPGIVDHYLANKMQEAVDVAVQLKYDRIREESNTENQQFLDSIDEGMKKVIKEQVKKEVSKITPKIEKLVIEQLESEVLVRSSKEANTSHAVAANLSELELKKILIDKMEANNSINRSDIQRQLYKALVDAYEADKILLDTYGDTVTIKRPRDGADDDQEPSAGTDRGSKRRRSGKEPASTSAPRETTTTTAGKTTTISSKGPQSNLLANLLRAEAKRSNNLPDCNRPRRQDPRESFDELTDTTFDFSAFVMNRLNVKTLTPELLAGPTFELMKGTCKSLTELEYFCEEVYKATTEKLDWINPEGRQYPHDLRQPLPLVLNSQGRHVIPFHHFINNDLEYLRGGESSRKYSTSVTKTKAADYGHIKWIEDLVPNSMWSQVIVHYDKFALWGVSHWGKKRRQFYAFAITRESARDVYSKRRIVAVTKTATSTDLRIQYIEDNLLSSCGRKSDKSPLMKNAIEQKAKQRRIMRSLEEIVGGEYSTGVDPYGFEANKDGDWRSLDSQLAHKIHNHMPPNLTDKHKDIMKAQVHVLRLPLKLETIHLSRSVESLKLKNFKKDADIKAFRNGMSMSVPNSTSPHRWQIKRWAIESYAGYDPVAQDHKVKYKFKEQAQSRKVNDPYNIFTRESQEVRLKTKDEA
ncbi:hypothetical protein Tco_0704161 [Tanacetum coccineum]|uniref:Uncharacterized protein n=1 Tax=Tanacetum coccineum TaxID=301880 RepID=A0ABQ4Y2P6_9ASTR